MNEYSKNLYRFQLPAGFTIHVSAGQDGAVQQSVSFPFEVLFRLATFRFADKFVKALSLFNSGEGVTA